MSRARPVRSNQAQFTISTEVVRTWPLFSTILLQHHLDETCAWLRCLSLEASTRAATLLAQQQAAAGAAGRGRPTRQARTPAAERREIWRVMQVPQHLCCPLSCCCLCCCGSHCLCHAGCTAALSTLRIFLSILRTQAAPLHAPPLPQELIRCVERRQRQDQLEDVTAQLMLLSAVRKVSPR